MGHCWGAGFAALTAASYPKDYSLLVDIAFPVCPTEIDRIFYNWNMIQAKIAGNIQAQKELKSVEGFWKLREPKGYFNGMMINKKWVGNFGGVMIGRRGFVGYSLRNMLSREYTFFDYVPYMMGMALTGPATWEIMITTDFRKQAPEYKIPVVMLLGRHDYNVVSSFAEEYFNNLKAPYKKIYWFEKSAHFPHFEETGLFQKVMIEEVYSLVNQKM